jgi:nicotinamidase-related amidase
MTSGLLVIDVQVGLFEGDRVVFDHQAVLGRIARLVEDARARSAPLVFVRDDQGPARWRPQTPGWRIHPAVTPRPDEAVVDKTDRDAFHQTGLASLLRGHGVDHLVTVGCMTQFSVVSTVCHALALGFHVTLIGDAHSTWDMPGISAEDQIRMHNAVLDGLDLADHRLDVVAAADHLRSAPPARRGFDPGSTT